MMTWLWEGQKNSSTPRGLDGEFALDLYSGAKKVWPSLPWELKQPNDLYLKGGKAAGILLEVLDQNPCRALILGLGFNVFFRPTLLKAVCLRQWTEDISKNRWWEFLDQLTFSWSQRANRAVS